MRAGSTFQPRFLRIVTPTRFVAALLGRTFRLFITGAPNGPQGFGRGAAFRTRGFFFGLHLRRVTTGKAVFAVRFAGDAFTIAGFAFARMEILVLIDKDRRVEIHFRFLRQCLAQLVFENGSADFFDRAFRQVVQLEGAE